MPTGSDVAAGDPIYASKMNLKLETVDNDDLDHAVATTAKWVFGVDAAGQDIEIFGDTSGVKIYFDASDDQLEFSDSAYLSFGNAQDVTIEWDGANLEILPKTYDTGAFHIGNGTLSFDFKWFSSAAAKYVLFDTVLEQLILYDINLNITGTSKTVATMTSTLTGATADNAWEITVTDSQTNSSGYSRGLYISCTAGGAKTASGEHNSLGVDLTVTGATPYAYISSFYMTTSGNPTIGLASALSIYMDDMGTALASQHILDLQTGNPTASAASTRETYARFRNHGTGTPTSMFFAQANNNAKAATYFLEQDANTVGPSETGTFTNDTIGTTVEDGFINILMGATAAKIPFWYDN
jgi:hypothetical protein